MSESVDPRSADLDGLIRWLDAERRRDSEASLSELIGSLSIEPERLVDLACVDLMQLRRRGRDVNVEDYLLDFPKLKQHDHLLDLIDAELCVAVELKQKIDMEDFQRRFPSLAKEVEELIQLDSQIPHVSPGAPPQPQASLELRRAMQGVDRLDVDNDLAASPSIQPQNADEHDQDIGEEERHGVSDVGSQAADRSQVAGGSMKLVSNLQEDPSAATWLQDQPVDLPEWFVVDQCVAKSPGRWLLRGHDSVRRLPMAMKVLELPVQLTTAQSNQLLDVCEASSNVRNPRWIAPRVAAIQRRHLGVVREWSYAQPWNTLSVDWRTQAKRLAEIAFAVESAHRVGATHGGLHFGNVMIDHEGRVLLVDGAASQGGIRRWFHGSPELLRSLDERVHADVQDMVKLVAATAVEWKLGHAQPLLNAVHDAASSDQSGACGAIGQWLTQCVDEVFDDSRWQSPSRLRWRQRFARWLAGDAS